jgi:O-antigen ligase
MLNNLIFILPVITLLLFGLNVVLKGNSVESYLLFILVCLPLMDLKITKEAWGGFKTFDAIGYYGLLFLFKDFTDIDLKNRTNFYFLLFVLFMIIMLLSGLASEFPDRTYINVFKALPIFIFARHFMKECYKSPAFHYKAIAALKISYFFALAFLFIQWAVGLRFTFYPTLSPNTIDPVFHIIRYPGVFYDSQGSGQYLAMGSFLFLYFPKDASRKSKMFNYAVFILAIIGINIAGSRAAFGGFAIGLAIAFFIAAKRYRIIGLVVVLLGSVIFTTISIHNGIFDRTKTLSDDLSFRQSIWKEAYEIAKRHPLLGIGSANYQNYVMRHAQGQYLEVEDGQLVYFDQPENGYLKILVEMGFIGFAAFLLFLIRPLITGFVFHFRGIFDRRIAFLMASLISWLVAFNTVYSIYDYRILAMVVSMIVLIVSYPVTETELYELD